MKQWTLVCLAVAVLLCGPVALVLADDVFPPPWPREGERTTFQNWDFSLGDNPTTPDEGLANPYGVPTATIFGGEWLQYGAGNHIGVWNLLTSDSYIDVPIANAPDHPDWNKLVWTQLTWSPLDGGVTPVVLVDDLQSDLIETIATHDGWLQSTWSITLPYNPISETVHITGIVSVGELVVDTKCVPEPSSLALLAMGAFGLAACIKRRRN